MDTKSSNDLKTYTKEIRVRNIYFQMSTYLQKKKKKTFPNFKMIMETSFYSSRTTAPEENCPNPKTNPNPNPKRRALFLGDNCPDTSFYRVFRKYSS